MYSKAQVQLFLKKVRSLEQVMDSYPNKQIA